MTDTTDTTTTETPVTTETPQATEVKMEAEVQQADQPSNEPAVKTEGEKTEEEPKPVENGTSETTATEGGEDAPPKLFVGRLPVGTKDTQLKELFSTYGEVTHCDIVGKYGFVHMKNKEEANEAMNKLNNHTLNGSNITVQLSTSTAKKTKKKQPRKNFADKKGNNNNNANNTGANNNNNRKQGVKNGFVQKNKNLQNNNNANNRNKNGGGNNANNNNRQNGNMNNKMRGRKFNNNRNMMNRQMMAQPQLAPMQGYYANQQPMNSFYQQPPMQPHQMSPGGGPRDMYYNNRPADNGQYYRSNGPAPQQMYASGMNMPVQPQQNYYQQQQPYSRGPVGNMNKMSPIPSQPAPQQMYPQMQMGPMNNAQPMGTGYQMPTGYGNGQMMGGNTNGGNNFPNRNGYANKARGNSNRFNNSFNSNNNNRANKRVKLN